jgi:hypothetical protein
MPERNFTVLISDLPKQKREQMETLIKSASLRLRQCVGRLQGYETGEEHANKLVWDINVIRSVLEEIRVELITGHNLPPDLSSAPHG